MRKVTVLAVLAFTLVPVCAGADLHPVERFVRERFPAFAFQPSAERSADPSALIVSHPAFYSDPVIATLGRQRVALRPLNARNAVVESANGKSIYQRPYASVDAVELLRPGRSEELLVLHDADAPLIYEYEIVELRGVAAVAIVGGAVHFRSDEPLQADGRFVALPRHIRIERPWVIDASGRRSEAHARWTLVGDQALPRILRLTVTADGLVYPILVDPSFSTTGSLPGPLFDHTATLLPDGKVLIAGGQGAFGAGLRSAYLYDPLTGDFTATAELNIERHSHTATLLPNGKVLLAGGRDGPLALSSAELYDPATGTFSLTGNLSVARSGHTATLLNSGLVLIAFGNGQTIALGLGTGDLSSAELYNPATGSFSATGSGSPARQNHTATLLANGKVLMAGGTFGSFMITSAELYDPATGAFTATGSINQTRRRHTATRLANGKVLLAGGDVMVSPAVTARRVATNSSTSAAVASAELYDPVAGTFALTDPLDAARENHSATLLPNGKVLIFGGYSDPPPLIAEFFDPSTQTFSPSTGMNSRYAQTATLLADGRVLIAGGTSPAGMLYDSSDATMTGTGSLAGRYMHTATPLPDGTVLIAGGDNAGALATAHIYSPASGTFSSADTLEAARSAHTATLLADGKVLIAGGHAAGSLQSAELYDAGAFTATGNLNSAREGHTATLLADGRVLIAGGWGGSGPLASAELYENGAFTLTGNLTARTGHTATLLINGKVLIAGGSGVGGAVLNSAQLYDPATGSFTATDSLAVARSLHTATLLPDGRVLIAGGDQGGSSATASAEIYDPDSGLFSDAGSFSLGRYNHTATLLPNGMVLLAGGQQGSSYNNTTILFEPLTGAFSVSDSLGTARTLHTATLLASGKLLIAAGYNNGYLASAEIYDAGLGHGESRRPVLSGWFPLAQPGTTTLSGTEFRGDSEASGGGTDSSPTNYPLLQFRRIDNDQMLFIRSGMPWDDTSFTTRTLATLANGAYAATIIVNGIPSWSAIILVAGMAAPAVPASITAVATDLHNVLVTWPSVPEVGVYELYRSTSVNGPYARIRITTATSVTDGPNLSAYTTYLYKVRAIGYGGAASGFSPLDFATTNAYFEANLAGVVINANHFFEVRNSVAAMRAAAALAPFTFSPIGSGVIVRAVHLTELRSALDPARAALGAPAVVYTDPAITAGGTTIKAAHLMELRTATQ